MFDPLSSAVNLDPSMDNPIKIQVPVNISYPALEGLLKKKMVGDYIPRQEEGMQEPPYAQILDVRIAGAAAGAYNVALKIRLRILRTMLKRDPVDLDVKAAQSTKKASSIR